VDQMLHVFLETSGGDENHREGMEDMVTMRENVFHSILPVYEVSPFTPIASFIPYPIFSTMQVHYAPAVSLYRRPNWIRKNYPYFW
jgi:hypothetical protein